MLLNLFVSMPTGFASHALNAENLLPLELQKGNKMKRADEVATFEEEEEKKYNT